LRFYTYLTCAVALFYALGPAAQAAQTSTWTYATIGSDDFSIGAGDVKSSVGYRGRQTLTIERHGERIRFRAHVRYTRSEASADHQLAANYVADVLPSGTLLSSSDRDPDYLTILNQPFAAQLDGPTLTDLSGLHGSLPFDFPSPFTGSSLHGYLQHVTAGPVKGHPSVAVRFEAAGRMRGALPDRPGLSLGGTIAMRGTAYYDRRTAVLLVLDTTVTISGNVSNRTSRDPVTIVYARSIRFVR